MPIAAGHGRLFLDLVPAAQKQVFQDEPPVVVRHPFPEIDVRNFQLNAGNKMFRVETVPEPVASGVDSISIMAFAKS